MADILVSKIQVPSLPNDNLILKDAEARQDLSTALATLTGNPLNFSTRSAQKANQTVISLAPIQDLHGYDHPWPAGGGKNQLPMTVDGIKALNAGLTWTGNSATTNGITFTLLEGADGSCLGINQNGTCTAYINFLITPFFNLPTGDYIISGARTTEDTNRILILNSSDVRIASTSTGGTFTLAEQTSVQARITISKDKELNNVVFYPMIRLATETDPTFAPYSNICPIDGRTETSLVGCGKNLFGGDALADRIVEVVPNASKNTTNETVTYLAANVQGKMLYNQFKPNTRYTFFFSVPGNNYVNLSILYTDGTIVNIYKTSSKPLVVFVSENNKSIKQLQGMWQSGLTILEYKKSGVFEGVLTADDFVPYEVSNDLTIQFGEKVYGATVELESGTVTVTWGYIAEYNGETLPGEWISDRDVYAPNTSPSTGAEVCYELATPRTIQLTPNEISLLMGINNISTDGDSISLTYRDGKVATLGDLDGLVKKIADCEDVEITDLQASDVLVWDATAGKWKNQQSTNTHVYSTTEQVVGTWIDGSTLYEKSYFVSSPTKGSTQIIQDANVANIEYLAKSQGSFQRDVGSYVTFESLDSYESSNFHSFLRLVKEAPSSNEIGVAYNITLSDGDISNLFITIQYTKNNS